MKQKLTEMKESDNSKITVEHFNTPLSIMEN